MWPRLGAGLGPRFGRLGVCDAGIDFETTIGHSDSGVCFAEHFGTVQASMHEHC